MKEKIKKAFKGVTHDLVFAWVFIAMFVYVLIESICEASYVVLLLVCRSFLSPCKRLTYIRKRKNYKRRSVSQWLLPLQVCTS